MKISFLIITTLYSVAICNATLVMTLTKYFQKVIDQPVFKEEYFDQIIDHFNFNSNGNQKYKQRYLITG